MRHGICKKVVAMVSCLCLVMVIGATVVSAADPVVLLSADFEKTTVGELPTDWVGQGKVVQDKFFAGKASLYVEDTNNADYMDVHLPLIAVKPLATYELSVMECVSDIYAGGNFAIFVREADADGKDIFWNTFFMEKSATWVEFVQQFKMSDKAAFIEIFIYAAATGKGNTASGWIDNLKIVEVK